MRVRSRYLALLLLALMAACAPQTQDQALPVLSPLSGTETFAASPYQTTDHRDRRAASASLWSGTRTSLFGDRRADRLGDILTVVIEIDDTAEIDNSSERSRSSDRSFGMPQFFGLPQRIDPNLPQGASLSDAIDFTANNASSGDGSVSRSEKLTLRIAATIADVLPNGVLAIEGRQEVRVNFELRELFITGYVRPADISRQNEITYDKIASARISYGGRGHITDALRPRYGSQALDAILPF
ncbi:flagellar basal body L-ring protein FlgH [Pelagovum sp. HNIBRBA483]|uniref:flagellar basal body L-ring protein FlgH n=1 Tax=Pelagovum sp. HNIBRBA483 TaxID=3233341 RepID=UPI0034A370F3